MSKQIPDEDLHPFRSMPVRVAVRIAATTTTLRALLGLDVGSEVVCDQRLGNPFELLVEERSLAAVMPIATDDTVVVKVLGPTEEEPT